LTPHLNGTRYLDKPPLFYWLIAITYTVFGVPECSARLPVALAGLGGVLMTREIGRHLSDDRSRSGVLAGLVLTTSVGYVVFSHQLLPDMVFACFTRLSFYGFLRAGEEDRARQPWSLLAYMCLALAVMTKGFVGLFPLAVLATYGLLSGRFHARRGPKSPWGGVVLFLLIVPWRLIIGWQHEGYFWHYFVNEHFLRFLGRGHPIGFISLPIFSLVLFLWLLPWSPYLALAMPRQWPHLGKPLPRKDAGHLLVLLWASMFLLFFALSRARLPQYCLPAMPALALPIGMGLDKRYTGRVSSTKGLLIATAISALLPVLALLLLPSYLERVEPYR
jgi:4-amino-4-deoxy-L-arabinose transferase-like glycosyltransferase